MELIDIPTERMAAATDLVVAVLAVWCVVYLRRVGRHEPFKRIVWSWAFGLLAVGATLGAAAHGLKMSPAVNTMLWRPLYLSLGLTVALVAVGAVYDIKGESVARRTMPIMIVVGILFYAATHLVPGNFLVFVIYETAVMIFALVAYGWLAVSGRLDGAGLMAAGILVSMIAAAVQTTGFVRFTLIWQFDHNGAFHLIQTIGILLLVAGLRAALRRTKCSGS